MFTYTLRFTLDKLNLSDLELLFLGVISCKVNLGESLRRRIFEYTSSVTKVDLSPVSGQLAVELNLEYFEYVAPEE